LSTTKPRFLADDEGCAAFSLIEIESSKGRWWYFELIIRSSGLAVSSFSLFTLIQLSISDAQADACPSPLQESKDKYI